MNGYELLAKLKALTDSELMGELVIEIPEDFMKKKYRKKGFAGIFKLKQNNKKEKQKNDHKNKD